MILYHYTSVWHLRQIMDTGYIKLSPSNLLYPVNMRIVNNCVVSDTDNYKPVIWTTTDDSFRAAPHGLAAPKGKKMLFDKTEVAIVFEDDPDFVQYESWAKKNNIDRKWFRELTRGCDYKSWFVSEKQKKYKDVAGIIFRPDIFELVKDGRA